MITKYRPVVELFHSAPIYKSINIRAPFDSTGNQMNQSWDQHLSGLSLTTNNDSDNLPAVFLCPLSNNSLISLEGEQSKDYLHGQLTCDMHKLNNDRFLRAAHCDAKGKMWAIVNTFTLDDRYLLSGHQAEINACLTQLKKYGVFSKTTITDASEQWFTFGLGGEQAASWLQNQWQIDVTGEQTAWDIPQGKVLKLDSLRFLLILDADNTRSMLAQPKAQLCDQDLWTALNIQAGIAHLGETALNQYVPQMLNLHCLDAISFEKGCYAGQEMVARMKYLGKNKRATFIVTGHANQMPSEGQELQLAIGDNWRRGGILINVAGTADKFYALAVMSNDVDADVQLRIKDQTESQLTLTPLPYSLATD
jgi:folate-binding protein YgfZ